MALFFLFQPITLISSNIEVVKPGKFPGGKTEIPFEFPLHVKGNKVLYETYHGVFVNIQVRPCPSSLSGIFTCSLSCACHCLYTVLQLNDKGIQPLTQTSTADCHLTESGLKLLIILSIL